eukprot:TRINITY_DN35408_c0_g1_i2.p1 TRINITY_DN35408_c0_g1~~TRINITY_DN35408_c0_g1_i2.p1  ORF type:complete len:200 (-),score=41.35 TRINITY_DN35408_c0_g1_i2:63-662(-)
MQQADDADLGEDAGMDWSDLLKPRAPDAEPEGRAVGAMADEKPSREVSYTGAAIGVGIGPGPVVHAGVQASPEQSGDALGVAVGALAAQDAARVADFLRSLREAKGAASSETLDELMKLMRTLPAPAGPRILLNAIRHEQPALFERLHESMKRTQQRVSASNERQGGYQSGADERQRTFGITGELLSGGSGELPPVYLR